MNKIKKIFLVVLSVVSCSLFANENQREKINAPFVFSFVSNEFYLFSQKDVVTPFAVGMLGSTVYQVDALQASSLYNFTHEVNGVQLSGILNWNTSEFDGVQGAGIFNMNSGDFDGSQLAGILNMNAGAFSGFQGAGIMNYAGGQDSNGVQAASILNIKKGNLKGAQIGLINICSGECNFQLGLINISKNGIIEIGTSYTSNDNIRYTFTSGKEYFYTVVGFMTDNPFRNGNMFKKEFFYNFENFTGVGTRLSFGIFNVGVEALYNNVFFLDSDNRFRSAGYISGRVAGGVSPVKNLSLVAGYTAGFEHSAYCNSDLAFEHKTSNLKTRFNNGLVIHHEVDVGIKVCLNN